MCRSGQVVGLLGPSGCGKTTLMRAIVGVQVVHSGTVTVLGLPAGSAPLRRRVGYVTQEASVYDDLTVRQNLDYFRPGARLAGDDVDRVIERVRPRRFSRTHSSAALGRAAQPGLAGRRAARLAGAARARRTDGGPRPGAAASSCGSLFHRLAADGASLLVSSHVMDEATRCDRLLLMRDGELLADDTPAGCSPAPGTDDTEGAFLALIEHGRTGHRHVDGGAEAAP